VYAPEDLCRIISDLVEKFDRFIRTIRALGCKHGELDSHDACDIVLAEPLEQNAIALRSDLSPLP
jgi:hypothetical protein